VKSLKNNLMCLKINLSNIFAKALTLYKQKTDLFG